MQVIQQQSNVTYYSFWLLTKLTYITFRLPHVQAIITGFQFAARRARSRTSEAISPAHTKLDEQRRRETIAHFACAQRRTGTSFVPRSFSTLKSVSGFRETRVRKSAVFLNVRKPQQRGTLRRKVKHMFIALVRSAKIERFTQWLHGVVRENGSGILMRMWIIQMVPNLAFHHYLPNKHRINSVKKLHSILHKVLQ